MTTNALTRYGLLPAHLLVMLILKEIRELWKYSSRLMNGLVAFGLEPSAPTMLHFIFHVKLEIVDRAQ